jgi:phage-related baseplate assembly protein
MAGAFEEIDLAAVALPNAVEALDYEAILSEMISELQAKYPAFTALVESDPVFKVLEVCAYRELLVRQGINEAVRAVAIAHAGGEDLDRIAARYEVSRLLLRSEDAGVTAIYEDDESLRRRVQLVFDGFSTAGPEDAYLSHALSADADVLDIAAHSESRAVVLVAVLSRVGNGGASAQLVADVDAALNNDAIRPLTDAVTVLSAAIVSYAVEAELTLFRGPDSAVVLQAATDAVQAYADESHRLGRDIVRSGIFAALHQEGVESVKLIRPSADITTAWNQAPYCTAITLTVNKNDE